MKYTTFLIFILFCLITSSCSGIDKTPMPAATPRPAIPEDVVIPPTYTLEEVLAAAAKFSPVCEIKKGDPIGH